MVSTPVVVVGALGAWAYRLGAMAGAWFWPWVCRTAYRKLAKAQSKMPCGVPGYRDPDVPCSGYEPRRVEDGDWTDCETDGHYLCDECCHKHKVVGVIDLPDPATWPRDWVQAPLKTKERLGPETEFQVFQFEKAVNIDGMTEWVGSDPIPAGVVVRVNRGVVVDG